MSPVVLFDGVCNLCNGAVQFVLDRERDGELRFAALQSSAAAELLARVGGEALVRSARAGEGAEGDPDSLVLVEGDRVYTRSDAALRIARHLRAPWRWLAAFAIVPRALRDAVYAFVARRRYGWFGKSEACRVPTPELRARFLA